MGIREAQVSDIPQLQEVRLSVMENRLSDPARITYDDYVNYLSKRGKGWVWEAGSEIAGFAVADLEEENIWALFIRPQFEGRGIGQQLHDRMLNWYFDQAKESVWLRTAPGTRAYGFYKKMDWTETGKYGADEVLFQYTYQQWKQRMMLPHQVILKWIEAFNRKDADGLAVLYHTDAINHQVANEPVVGAAAIRNMFESEFAQADMVCIKENLFEDGEWAILEWKDPLGIRGCGFFHVKEGKIIFQRGYWDKLSFLRIHGLPLPIM